MNLWYGITRKKCQCWICLEESRYDSSWIIHRCGCNLQAHKVCYLRWQLEGHYNRLNESGYLYKPILSETDKEDTMCYLIDGHRSLQYSISVTEVITSIPGIGASLFAFTYIPLILSLEFLGFKGLTRTLVRVDNIRPKFMEIEHCPQCKKPIVKTPVSLTSGSILLEVYYRFKTVTTNIAIFGTVTLLGANLSKWWFKLGLWQLRQIFSEHMLRHLFNISTTKALDVYGDTIQGLNSVEDINKVLILGFPIYLLGVTASSSFLSGWRWLWTFLLYTRNRDVGETHSLYGFISVSQNENFINKCFGIVNVTTLFYRKFISPLVNAIYFQRVKDCKALYFIEQSENMIARSPSNCQNIVIRKSVYERLVEIIVWPLTGKLIGGKIYDIYLWLHKKYDLQLGSNITPNEYRMAFSLVGCSAVVACKEIIDLYATHLRIKELEYIKTIVNKGSN